MSKKSLKNDTLQPSLIILLRIKNQLKNAADGIRYLIRIKSDELNGDIDNMAITHINTSMFGLITYSFIWYVAFIDEYNKYFSSKDASLNKRISLIKTNCQKYLDNIQTIFGDLKKARNQVLAHGYRDNKGKRLTNMEINQHFTQLIQYQSFSPYLQISNIVSLITSEIEKEFGVVSEDRISLQKDETKSRKGKPGPNN